MRGNLQGRCMLGLLVTGIIATNFALGEWSSDPTARTPVCTADYAQGFPRLTRVEGGFVATWQDMRREGTHEDIYAQKIGRNGEMLWPQNGRVIAEGPAGNLVHEWQASFGLVNDGTSGALIVWHDYYKPGWSYWQAFASRVSSDAAVAWGDPGQPIQAPDTATPLMANSEPGANPLSARWDIVGDSEGGAFIPVSDGLGRFSADGRLRTNWFHDPADVPAGSRVGKRLVPVIGSDGRDGVVVVWPQGWIGSSLTDSILARKLVDPETAWPDDSDSIVDAWGRLSIFDPDYSVTVCSLSAVPDGAGGVIVVWIDDRVRLDTNYFRVYAQRVGPDGKPLWPEGGVELSGDVGTSGCWGWTRLAVSHDGEGGAVAAWVAWDGVRQYQRAQRVNSEGQAQWAAGGVILETQVGAYYDFYTHGVIRATDGNFIVLYHNKPQGRLVARKLDAEQGAPMWGEGRVVYEGCLVSYSDDHNNAPMVSDGSAGAVVAFSACDGNIYAHRLKDVEIFKDGFEGD